MDEEQMFKPFEELCNMIENLNKKAEKTTETNNTKGVPPVANHHPESQETTCKYCTEVLAKVAENEQKIQLIQVKLELMHSRFDVFERSLEKLLKAATQPKEQPEKPIPVSDEPEKPIYEPPSNQNSGNISVTGTVDMSEDFELIGKNSHHRNNPIINNPTISNDNNNHEIEVTVVVPIQEEPKQILILVPEHPAVVDLKIEEPEIPKNPSQLKEELICLVKEMEEKQGVGPSLPSGAVSRYRIIIALPEVLELVRNDLELHQKLVKLGKDFPFLKYPN